MWIVEHCHSEAEQCGEFFPQYWLLNIDDQKYIQYISIF